VVGVTFYPLKLDIFLTGSSLMVLKLFNFQQVICSAYIHFMLFLKEWLPKSEYRALNIEYEYHTEK